MRRGLRSVSAKKPPSGCGWRERVVRVVWMVGVSAWALGVV